MGFADAVRAVIGNYAGFSGRARRSEYWYWSLATLLGYLVAVVLSALAKPFGVLAALFYLAILVPSLAVAVRRLHDTGKSGWFFLLALIPLVGGIVLFVFFVTDSAPGENRYGPNPKGVGGPPAYGYGPL